MKRIQKPLDFIRNVKNKTAEALANLPKKIREFYDLRYDPERKIFITLAGILLILMPILSLKSGISADEDKYHYKHGKNVYKYYTTLGKDKTCLQRPPNEEAPLEMYGAVFDVSTVIVNDMVEPHDEYRVRHIMNSMAGWMAILFTALIAVMLGGWRAGIITLIFMFLSPRFLGHSFNNPKDIPFTAAYVFSIWGMLRFVRAFEKEKLLSRPLKLLNYAWPIILGIGLAIGVRVGGVMLPFYFIGLTGLWYLFRYSYKLWFKNENLIRLLKLLGIAAGIGFLGYFLGVLLWPYAHVKPFVKTQLALDAMEQYGSNLRQVFEAEVVWSNKIPWYYLPKYILITIPEIVIIGLVSVLFLYNRSRKKDPASFFFLFFVLIFPVFYIIYKDSNLYNGWRHAMFVYPPLVVLSALGVNLAIDAFYKQKYIRWGIIGITALLLLLPLRFIFANHPNEYIYYNQLVGGVKNAYGYYEMDYFYNSQKAAADWLIENRIKNYKPEDSTKIIVAMYRAMPYYFRDYEDKVKVEYVKYHERGAHEWDYYITPSSFVPSNQLRNDLWPTRNAIHTIDVDGKPICAVFERQNRYDLEAHAIISRNKVSDLFEAIRLLELALEEDPNYDWAQVQLANCYYRLYLDAVERLDDFRQSGIINAAVEKSMQEKIAEYKELAETECTNSLILYNDNAIGLNIKAGISYQEGNARDAMRIQLKNIEINPQNHQAFLDLMKIYLDQKNYGQAEKRLNDALRTQSRPDRQYFIYISAAPDWQKRGRADAAANIYINAMTIKLQEQDYQLASNILSYAVNTVYPEGREFLLDRAAPVWLELGTPDVAASLFLELMTLVLDRGDHAKAIEYLRKAYAVNRLSAEEKQYILGLAALEWQKRGKSDMVAGELTRLAGEAGGTQAN